MPLLFWLYGAVAILPNTSDACHWTLSFIFCPPQNVFFMTRLVPRKRAQNMAAMPEYSTRVYAHAPTRGHVVRKSVDYTLKGSISDDAPRGWSCDQILWCGPEGHAFKNRDSVHSTIDVGTLLVGFSRDFITVWRDWKHMESVFGPYVGHGLEKEKTIQPPYDGFMYFVMNDTNSYRGNLGHLEVKISTAADDTRVDKELESAFAFVPSNLPVEAPDGAFAELSFRQQRQLALIAELGEIGAAYAARFPLSSAEADGDRVSVFLDKVCGRLPFAWCKDDNP